MARGAGGEAAERPGDERDHGDELRRERLKSWQGAAAIQGFVLREAPQLVLIEYLVNDYVDAEAAGGVAQYIDNMERLFDLLLRWGQADIAVVLPNPNGEAGTRTSMIPISRSSLRPPALGSCLSRMCMTAFSRCRRRPCCPTIWIRRSTTRT